MRIGVELPLRACALAACATGPPNGAGRAEPAAAPTDAVGETTQSITLETVPAGARCTVTQAGALVADVPATPQRVELPRQPGSVDIACSKPGHLPRSIRIRSIHGPDPSLSRFSPSAQAAGTAATTAGTVAATAGAVAAGGAAIAAATVAMPLVGLGVMAIAAIEQQGRVRHYYPPVPDLLLRPIDPDSRDGRLFAKAERDARQEVDETCARWGASHATCFRVQDTVDDVIKRRYKALLTRDEADWPR